MQAIYTKGEDVEQGCPILHLNDYYSAVISDVRLFTGRCVSYYNWKKLWV